MPDPRISVIVRCLNEEKHIGTLLEAIGRQTVRDVQVVVVDSGSTDRTLEVASRFPVTLVQISPDDFTFGYSLNQGCRAATGEFLVIASAHVVPCSADWLERIIAPFSDPRVALVYGRQVGDQRTRFSEHQLFAKQFPAKSNPAQKTPFCNNANAAVRRALWSEQPYDETLSGLEDLAWAKWVIDRGHRIAYQAEAAVVHIHEETPARIKRRYLREAIALKHIFPDSHVYFVEFLRLLVQNVGMDMLAALSQGTLFRNFLDILTFRTMQYWGTFRGMNYRSPLTHELIVQFYYPQDTRGQEPPASPPAALQEHYDSVHR